MSPPPEHPQDVVPGTRFEAVGAGVTQRGGQEESGPLLADLPERVRCPQSASPDFAFTDSKKRSS